MQWLINEFKQFKVDVEKMIESGITKFSGDHAERLTKLEGEIRALKARMGKKSDA